VLEASIQLTRELAQVGVARLFVDQTMREWGLDQIRDEAVLITSELSANAVLHARTAFGVTLRSDGAGVRIEVRDQSDRMPAPPYRQRVTTGRGLAIVDSLATSWGARTEGSGKDVWAEIGPRGLPGTGEGDRRNSAGPPAASSSSPIR
jgi:anti-sigma regulatory factor (Ser/Thr protein kinase)